LLYNINQATKQGSWGSSFHPVLLYGSFKHLPSGSKNIKEYLYHITNYIKNKNIDHNKPNNIPDPKSIGKVA